MKKLLLMLLCGVMILSCVTGCGAKRDADAPGTRNEGRLSAVVTIFPVYDWLRELLGERADRWDITLLASNGADMHSFQPSTADIAAITACDLFLYVGGASDAWVEGALRQAGDGGPLVLSLLDMLGEAAVTEELAEGMQTEEEEAGDLDEHVWLSLRNAQVLCSAIAQALTGLDPEGGDVYQSDLSRYDEALAALDAEYRAAVDSAALDTLLFGDRFPFRYLADDYGLAYYAAFPGCSAETEASFETIAFLAGKLAELRLPAVMILDGSDGRIAETIIESAGVDAAVLRMDSMQTGDRDGDTYLSAMERNLAALKAALDS